jgi:hypothetical protein
LFVNFADKTPTFDSNTKRKDGPNCAHKDTQNESLRLKRHQSLIELKQEQWEEERKQQGNADLWYQKFDSFHPTLASLSQSSSLAFPLNNSKSLADLRMNVGRTASTSVKGDSECSHRFSSPSESKSQYFRRMSPNPFFVPSERIALQRFNRSVSDVSNLEQQQHQRSLKDQMLSTCPSTPSLLTGHTSDDLDDMSCLNATPRNFRRFSRTNPEEQMQKRLKQIEYQNCLRLQLLEKEMNRKLMQQRDKAEDERLEQKLRVQQTRIRDEFELDQHRPSHLRGIREYFLIYSNPFTNTFKYILIVAHVDYQEKLV